MIKAYLIKKAMDWIRQMYKKGGKKYYHLSCFGIKDISTKRGDIIITIEKEK